MIINKIAFLMMGFIFTNSDCAAVDFMAEFEIRQQNLLKNQMAEDVSQIIYTLDATQEITHVAEKNLRTKGVDQFAIIRFGDNKYTHFVWVLYRANEKNYTEKIMSVGGEPISLHSSGEAISSEWDNVFHDFFIAQQKSPSPPLKEGRGMIGGQFWNRGYSGVVNVYDKGEIRTYLLATDDIKTLYQQSAYDKFLCSTFFSGLHCKNGDYAMPGWVNQKLEALMKNSQESRQKIIMK